MTTQYRTPGVYIEEITGEGVIAGVGTSTAAFLGPAEHGPVDRAERITTYERFNELYGSYLRVGSRSYYMAFAVKGFFANGGREAYILRVGSGRAASAALQNGAANAEDVAILRARAEGAAGKDIKFAADDAGRHPLARPRTTLEAAVAGGGLELTVKDSSVFKVGDIVVNTATPGTRATITTIAGKKVSVDVALAGNAAETIEMAPPITGDTKLRLEHVDGLETGSFAIVGPDDERVEIADVDARAGRVTLTKPLGKGFAFPAALRKVFPLALAADKVQSSADRGDGTALTLQGGAAAVARFRPGDTVDIGGTRATVVELAGSELVLGSKVAPTVGDDVRIADVEKSQRMVRLTTTAGLVAGAMVAVQGPGAAASPDVVELAGVDGARFVSFRDDRTTELDMAGPEAEKSPYLVGCQTRLVVTAPSGAPSGGTVTAAYDDLSSNYRHPRYILNAGVVPPDLIEVGRPDTPPKATGKAALIAAAAGSLANGQDDAPATLGLAHYEAALRKLAEYDEVNLVCIPDAAADPSADTRQAIQTAQINHCVELADRFAILDSFEGAEPYPGAKGVETQRPAVESDRGFAALYYPWLELLDPFSTPPQTRRMTVPPSGHIAGVMAREDRRVGVHKAPANVTVADVLGLERVLTDRQQEPLNDAGINCLRIFPGGAQVVVWGARTTVRKDVTDWRYVNVRRLLLFLEESIQEGLRWAVFEPNDLILWQKLKRVLNAFLERVWRDGALFGATAEQAFQVRIDEGLNPPSVRALGQLFIEVKVAPVRPAEFIVVRIGLWDGGGDVNES